MVFFSSAANDRIAFSMGPSQQDEASRAEWSFVDNL